MASIVSSTRGGLVLSAAIFLGFLGGCGDGAGGGAGGGGGPDASTGPFTVTGLVLDQLSAEPLAGATVFVDGEGVVTDLSGQFTAENVEPPYDVAIRASGSADVRVYRGITVADPTLLARNKTYSDHWATVSGTVEVAETTTADTVHCGMDGPRELSGSAWKNSSGSSPIAWTMSAGNGNVAARWFGESSIEGTIHCVVERRPLDVLTRAFYGSKAITLATSGDFDGQAVPLAEVELATAVANVSAPAAFAEVTVRAGTIFENGSSDLPLFQTGAPGEHWIPMWLLPGTRTIVTASGTADLGKSESGVVAPAAATVEADLVLLAPPSVTSPAADATVPFTDPIAWTGGGHVFMLRVVVPSGAVEVVTTEESAELPDLAPFGLGDPTGAGTVGVYEYGPVTTVDELVDGTAFFELLSHRRDYQSALGYVEATLN